MGTFAASAFNAGTGLITGIIQARILAPEGRGELAIIMFWPALIASLLILGLPASATHHSARMDIGSHDRLATTVIGLAVVVSAAMIGVAWLVMPLIVKDQQLVYLIRLYAAVLLPFQCIAMILEAFDQGRLRFGYLNFTRLLPQAIYFLGLLVLIAQESVSLPAILLCHVAGIAATAIIRLAIHRGFLSAGFDLAMARDVIRTGARFYPGFLLTIIRLQADRLIVILLFAKSDVGLCVVAATHAAQPLSLISGPFNLLLFPRVAAATDGQEKTGSSGSPSGSVRLR